jgi:SAM-dependent methyltransferase
MAASAILELGCGRNRTAGAVGVDFNPDSAADIIHDLNVFPWPLESDSFDRVICRHVLEHLDDIMRVMAEIHRVCKDNGVVEIIAPHFSSARSWDDPTHKHSFTLKTFEFFGENHPYRGKNLSFEVLKRRLTFSSSLIKSPGRLVSSLSWRWYENNLAFIIPARSIEVTLRVRKGKSIPVP